MKFNVKKLLLITVTSALPLFSADPSLQAQLRNAINSGDRPLVDSLIEAGADISDGAALLREIIGEDDSSSSAMVISLLERGVDFSSAEKGTPLAFRTNSKEVLAYMYRKGLSPESVDERNRTLLIKSLVPNRYKREIVALHIEQGVPVNHEDLRGESALTKAIVKADTAVVSLLVKNGAEVNRKNRYGIAPILYCDSLRYSDRRSESEQNLIRNHLIALGAKPVPARNYNLIRSVNENSIEEIRSLISAGAEVNFVNNRGESPLFLAMKSGNREIIDLIISAGAELNCTNSSNESPLMIAVRENNFPLVQKLVKSGADINFKTPEGRTALFECTASGKTEIYSYLREKGADITVVDSYGETLLFGAARNGNLPLVKSLLAEGVDCCQQLTTERSKGATALNDAMALQHTDIVKALISAGITGESINLAFSRSFGPYYGNKFHKKSPFSIDFVNYLLDHGLNPGKDQKHSAEMLSNIVKHAAGDHQYELLTLLQSHGADLGQIPHALRDLFLTGEPNIKTAELLLKSGADPREYLDDNGRTLLYYLPPKLLSDTADQPDSLSKLVFKILMEKGLDINHRDQAGQTPLAYYASLYNNRGEEHFNPVKFYDIALSLGAPIDLNIQDRAGTTALMELSKPPYSYRPKINPLLYRELIRRGADASIQDKRGLYAFQMRNYSPFEYAPTASLVYGKESFFPEVNDSVHTYIDAGRNYSFELSKEWNPVPSSSQRQEILFKNRETGSSEISIQNIYKGFEDSYKTLDDMLKSLDTQLKRFKDIHFLKRSGGIMCSSSGEEIVCTYSANGGTYYERLIAIDLSDDFYILLTVRTKNSREEFERVSREPDLLLRTLTHHTGKKWFSPTRKAKELTINGPEGTLFSSGKILQSLSGETVYIKEYREFYPSGTLKSVTGKKQGLSHGKFRHFYENGAVKTEGRFHRGRKSGSWITYKEDGSVERKEEFPKLH